MKQSHRTKPQRHIPHPDFHGAAVVTADGREQPITEEKVRAALARLERQAAKRTKA